MLFKLIVKILCGLQFRKNAMNSNYFNFSTTLWLTNKRPQGVLDTAESWNWLDGEGHQMEIDLFFESFRHEFYLCYQGF